MSAPFEKFTVEDGWNCRRTDGTDEWQFRMNVWVALPKNERRNQAKIAGKFIKDAIREKLEREREQKK